MAGRHSDSRTMLQLGISLGRSGPSTHTKWRFGFPPQHHTDISPPAHHFFPHPLANTKQTQASSRCNTAALSLQEEGTVTWATDHPFPSCACAEAGPASCDCSMKPAGRWKREDEGQEEESLSAWEPSGGISWKLQSWEHLGALTIQRCATTYHLSTSTTVGLITL